MPARTGATTAWRGGRPICCRSWPTPNCTSRSWRTCSRCRSSGSPGPCPVPIDASPRPAPPQGRHRPGRRRGGGGRAGCGTAAARVRVARGSARNASRDGRVVAGPEQGRHQRRRCPAVTGTVDRGPRRQPRATGPSGGGRSFEQSSAGGDREPGARPRRCSHPCTTRFSLRQRQRRPSHCRLLRHPRRHPRRGHERRHRRRARLPPATPTPTPSASTLHAHAHAERVYLHADAHDERIHARADAERVCLGDLGADAHCFRVGLATDFGIAHACESSTERRRRQRA